MIIEKSIKGITKRVREFKDTFYNPKKHDETLGIGAPTEYDIDRIKGKYNDKQQSYKGTQRND